MHLYITSQARHVSELSCALYCTSAAQVVFIAAALLAGLAARPRIPRLQVCAGSASQDRQERMHHWRGRRRVRVLPGPPARQAASVVEAPQDHWLRESAGRSNPRDSARAPLFLFSA